MSLPWCNKIVTNRYLEWLNFVINQRNLDILQMISMVYDSISELTIMPDYAESICLLFRQLGACGVSILVMSCNDGVGWGHCRNIFGHVQFYIGFPASCTCGVWSLPVYCTQSQITYWIVINFAGPLVTGVGGTASSMESNDPKIANRISGGSFLDIFRFFKFQAPTMTAFLGSIGNQYSGLYKCVYSCVLTQPTHSYLHNLHSPGGQGVPDIAMQLFNYQIILNCRGNLIDSTSCATHVHLTPFLIPSLCCPSLVTWLISHEQTMAALFSLLNDYLISNQRPLLSWLNVTEQRCVARLDLSHPGVEFLA